MRITIWGGKAAEQAMLDRLPMLMAQSQAYSIRFNNKLYNSSQGADQLRGLIASAHATTLKQLIAAVASREKETGSQCAVFGGSQPQPLRNWIIDQYSNAGWHINPQDVEDASVH